MSRSGTGNARYAAVKKCKLIAEILIVILKNDAVEAMMCGLRERHVERNVATGNVAATPAVSDARVVIN
jgi:hypothetical protein